MKQAKCPSCGANINVNEEQEAGICPYCKSAYSTERAISAYTNQTTNNASVINNYYTTPGEDQSKTLKIPRTARPTLNIGLFVIGLFFYIIPGVIYYASVKKKQKEWDEKYTY